MPCEHITMPDGTRGVVCSRGGRRAKPKLCVPCARAGRETISTKLCDHKGCDMPLCNQHAVTNGAIDFCAAHAAARGLRIGHFRTEES